MEMINYGKSKLILIEDVEDLGRSGDIVPVRPGFSRNFLLPQDIRCGCRSKRTAHAGTFAGRARKKAIQDKKESEELAAHIEGKTLTTIVKVDHEGHMYGSVSASDIVHLIQEQGNLTVEKRAIIMKHALKEIGVHQLAIKLKEGVTAAFTLKIVPEEDMHAEAAQKQPEA